MKVCPQCGGTYPADVGFCPMDGARLLDASEGDHHNDPPGGAQHLLGQTLDRRYRLDEVIGEGAMAFVYRATHTLIGKSLAIKLLRPELLRDAEVVRRFLQEARLASSVKHPNVVDISDYGELADGGAYYVMEHLRGCTLAARLHTHGALPPVEAVAIALQICHGLEAAHDQGIVHRDLKPANVFLRSVAGSADPHVKLLDFGIARIGPRRVTAAGTLLGTPSYMSPEQARGEDVDQRADLYALGTMLFEMLVGWVPFKSDDIGEVLHSQVFREPPRIEAVRPALGSLTNTSELVWDLLAKSPDDRPAAAAAVRERLSKALERDFPDGSKVRMLKSTLAMGSCLVEDGQSDPTEKGKAFKEAPFDWGRTERPAEPNGVRESPRGSAKRPGPPPGIEPTPMAEGRSRQPNLLAVLAGTSVLAGVTTFAVYSALVGFPTSAVQAAPAPASTPSPTAATPAAPKRPDPPTALGRVEENPPTPAEPATDFEARNEAVEPPDVSPDAKPEEGSEQPAQSNVDRKVPSPRSKVKSSGPRRSKPRAENPSSKDSPKGTPEGPTKGENVPDPPHPAHGSKPPQPAPPPAEAPESKELKDPFD